MMILICLFSFPYRRRCAQIDSELLLSEAGLNISYLFNVHIGFLPRIRAVWQHATINFWQPATIRVKRQISATIKNRCGNNSPLEIPQYAPKLPWLDKTQLISENVISSARNCPPRIKASQFQIIRQCITPTFPFMHIPEQVGIVRLPKLPNCQ